MALLKFDDKQHTVNGQSCNPLVYDKYKAFWEIYKQRFSQVDFDKIEMTGETASKIS